jgi:hypothetical protein
MTSTAGGIKYARGKENPYLKIGDSKPLQKAQVIMGATRY